MKRLGTLLIGLLLVIGIAGCGGGLCSLAVASTEGRLVRAPGEGMFAYELGTVANLKTEAEAGYYFLCWTGDVDTIADVNSAATTVTMNGDYAIVANFMAEWVAFPEPDVGIAIRGDIGERGYLFPSDVQDHNPFH